MKTLTTFTVALFAASLIALAGPANAGGDCGWGHSTKTAESSTPIIAEGTTPQTPAPSPSG